jgi:hypothetical protein
LFEVNREGPEKTAILALKIRPNEEYNLKRPTHITQQEKLKG